ncbi:MAG: aldo/keto reductase [Sphingomonadales bacterium]|nr:MAG: aldo/keto reductase [Sphingomonadales bacterium]
MRYSKLGSSGLIVSKLAFGTMTLGAAWKGPLAAFDASETDALVGRALDAGINFFDTADVYHRGESETLLGKALGSRRKEAVISTKVGMRMDQELGNAGLSARHIHTSIDASLRRLGTDHVDVYICHRPDPLTPLEETLDALDAVIRAGKARYLGFSNWPAWLAAKAVALQQAKGLARFITGQMYYSLLARDLEQEHVPMARDAGVGTMVWSPLSSGFLSGKYTREDPEGANGRLASMDLLPFDRERGYAIVDALKNIAAAREVPVAAVALAWVLDRPMISTAIIGFTSAAQFDANLAAADLVLTAEEVATLDAASAPVIPYPQNFIARFDGDARATATQ